MPAVFGNGLSSIWPFEQDDYEADLVAHSAIPSPLRMSLMENGVGDFSACISAEADVPDAVFVMIVVVAEEVPAYQGSTTFLPYHAKLFLTSALGDAFSIARGDSVEIRKTFDPDPAWDLADLGVVCWVQRDGGTNPSPSPDVPVKHEVLQAAYAAAAATDVHDTIVRGTVTLGTPVPNPSRGPTRFAFETAARSAVTVAVYDVAGRRVAVLFEGSADPGLHDLIWDGCDARGRRCSSGIYFVRLLTEGSEAATRKLVLVR